MSCHCRLAHRYGFPCRYSPCECDDDGYQSPEQLITGKRSKFNICGERLNFVSQRVYQSPLMLRQCFLLLIAPADLSLGAFLVYTQSSTRAMSGSMRPCRSALIPDRMRDNLARCMIQDKKADEGQGTIQRLQALSLAATSTSPTLHMYHMKRLLQLINFSSTQETWISLTCMGQTLRRSLAYLFLTCTSICRPYSFSAS